MDKGHDLNDDGGHLSPGIITKYEGEMCMVRWCVRKRPGQLGENIDLLQGW